MSKFKGKSAIVTGAGAGIGKAIAESLIAEGAQVMINDIDQNLVNDFTKSNAGLGLAGDMSELEDIKSLVEYTIEKFGKIDLLVCNAAVTHFDHFLDISEEDFDKVVNLNLKGTFFLAQQVALHMKESGGKIVLMSSNISTLAYPNLAIYSMTKAAINMMAKSLAVDLSPHKINVNSLAPGPTATSRTVQEIDDYHGSWGKILPTGRPGEVEDVAKLAMFLLSDEASQINGQTIFVDGGWSGLGVVPNVS